MENNFIKIHSTKDIIIITILIIIGILLVVLPIGGATNVTGYILTAIGLLLIPFCKNGYKDAWEGMRYTKKEFYFANNSKSELIASVTNNPQNINITEKDKGNTLRLVIFYSHESGRAFLQVEEYVPYKYEPCTEVIEHKVSQIGNLIK